MAPPSVISRSALDELISELAHRGFTVIGPTVRDGAILYEEISSTADLPEGLTDEQEGGSYRLAERDDSALFAYNVGPNSWKSHLFPSRLTLWRGRKRADGEIGFKEEPLEVPRYAFIGVRSCDLAAIGIQDKVFIGNGYTDPDYEARRQDAFIVAVNCSKAGNTCFCVSMETGPKAESGFDLALTELMDEGGHRFLVEVGSQAGAELLSTIEPKAATEDDRGRAQGVSEECASQMGRELDTDGIKELLYRNMENPRWDEVSERCLTCGNCTLVCPTCFCHTVEDVTDLAGEEAERVRLLDSCFTLDLFLHPRRQHPQLGTLALPPVDDPQARHLDRPVRDLRLRRLWALHHLVSGSDRYHRGGSGDPRDRPRSGSRRGKGDQCRPLSSCSSKRPYSTGCRRISLR